MLNLKKMLTGNVRRVSHVHRYASHPVTRKENVAEHSYYAALYSLSLAKGLQEFDPFIQIDYGLLLSSALVHDLDETISGDFIRMVKYSSPEFTLAAHNLAKSCVDKISTELDLDIRSLWLNAKNPDTIEGQIMALADFLTVVSYVIEEFLMGNSHMTSVMTEIGQHLVHIKNNNHKSISHEFLINCADKALSILESTSTLNYA